MIWMLLKIFNMIRTRYKLGIRFQYFLLIIATLLSLYVLNFIIEFSLLFMTDTKCIHQIYTLLPRLFFYFLFLDNPYFSFISHISNDQVIEIVNKLPFFDYCNSLLERTIIPMQTKIIPQPIFLKLIYYVNIFAAVLFVVFVLKILIQNFKFNILKVLILVYMLCCIFLQGSFLMIYITLLFQLYLNDRH